MKLPPSLPRATRPSDLVQRLSGLVRPGLLPVLAALALVTPSTAGVLSAQEQVPVARLVAEPPSLTMVAGTSAPMTVRALDAAGRAIPDAVVRVFGSRRAVAWSEGVVSAFQAGSHVLTATAAGAGGAPITLEIPVTVSWPAITSLQIEAQEGRLYTGTTMAHGVHGLHADGSERPNLEANWESSNPSVASVDRFGNVRGLKPGSVTITARAGGATATRSHTVAANPVTSLEIIIGEPDLATGDVIHLTATTRRSNG